MKSSLRKLRGFSLSKHGVKEKLGAVYHCQKQQQLPPPASLDELVQASQGVLHMYSGNGDACYAENSDRQRNVFQVLQPLFEAALQKFAFPEEGPLRITNLGCATGTNTVSDVDFVVKTLTNLCGNGHGGGLMPELQAYFSDWPCNDFNELFGLLERRGHSWYFVAGVPRSFYNVLFPRSTIHPPDLLEESSAFQIQVNFSAKTTMLWVHATDLVQDLLQKLACRLGIPSSCLRLLYQGKQLMQPLSLSFYNIQKDASIGVSFRLRGGSFGQTSSAPFFSYKDAARKNNAQPQASSKTAQPNGVPKPFLVDKSEEIPSISFSNPGVENCYQTFVESGLICRFNGLWPRTADLYQWVHSFWTKKCKIFLCSKGFFLVVFDSNEDYQKALTRGLWFWGTAGLFLTPWFPDFDPSTAVISKIPIWVRLPNLPAHFWDFSVFLAIGNTLGRYLATDTSRRKNGLYTYGRLCAEIDISKGLPDQINLKFGDFHWTQSLDYENTAFCCRHCHQTGHLQSTCSQLKDKKNNLNRKSKSKRWNPFEPPHPLGDLDFSSSEEEESEADVQVDEEVEVDMQNEEIPGDPPSAVPEAPSNPQISQKRAHLSSSSDSEKEAQPSDQNHLQLVTSQPISTGWTKVSKKKGKKCRVIDNNPSG